MTTRLFLDACLLIDYFLAREPFFDSMVKLRIAGVLGDVQLWCSAKSFTDAFYVGSKAVPSNELQRAFCNSLDFLQVASVDGEDVREACLRGWDDFEDCLVAVTAERCRADVLLTRDTDGFRRSVLPVMTPRAYLDDLQKTQGVWYVTETLGA